MLSQEALLQVVDVGIALATEKNSGRLLTLILDTAMRLSNCDAGTLYLYRDNMLEFCLRKTISQQIDEGADGRHIALPPVPMEEGNVCAYAALYRKLVNIPDVYHEERFDFSGPKRYDALTGYHTRAMIVVPMENTRGELIGVLQLINAQNEKGAPVAFTEDDEFVLRALGAQAAVAITNMNYVQDIKLQLHSFAEAFATAVDARTPYNALHARNVTSYAELMVDYINKKHEQGECEEYFDEERKEQLILAAALHDIGKMAVPLSVMNKTTRLEKHISEIEKRAELILAYYEIDWLKGRMTKQEYTAQCTWLGKQLALVREVNETGFLTDAMCADVEKLAGYTYVREDGTKIPFLTEYEKDCLRIRKGTLTDEERAQMEQHVVLTGRILGKVHFSSAYAKTAAIAGSHHEFLDGSGYPSHKMAAELDLEMRILTIADIYDALTATDRPYKKPMSKEQAFAILREMAEAGKIDQRLVEWFYQAHKS